MQTPGRGNSIHLHPPNRWFCAPLNRFYSQYFWNQRLGLDPPTTPLLQHRLGIPWFTPVLTPSTCH